MMTKNINLQDLRTEVIEMRDRLGLQGITVDVILDTAFGKILDDSPDFPAKVQFFDQDGDQCEAVSVHVFATILAKHIEYRARDAGFDYVVIREDYDPLFVKTRSASLEDMQTIRETFQSMLKEQGCGLTFAETSIDELIHVLFSRMSDVELKQALWDLLQSQREQGR